MGFSRQEYWSGLPFPFPVDPILSEPSTMTCPSWVAVQGMTHGFIELDKAVVHVISLVSFLSVVLIQGSVCALQESVSPLLCKFWWLYGGVNGDLLQEGVCHTQVCCTQGPCPCSRPLLTHISAGDTQTVLAQLQGLWVLVLKRFIWTLWVSLGGKGFDSKCDFTPPTILLELLLCSWTWGIFFFFLVGSSVLQSMVV